MCLWFRQKQLLFSGTPKYLTVRVFSCKKYWLQGNISTPVTLALYYFRQCVCVTLMWLQLPTICKLALIYLLCASCKNKAAVTEASTAKYTSKILGKFNHSGLNLPCRSLSLVQSLTRSKLVQLCQHTVMVIPD